MMKTVVAGALGECVHVAGVLNFLRLAELAGWRVVFLGPAVSVEKMLEAARREKADASTDLGEILVGVSYRLTPETGERLLGAFAEEADDLRAAGVRFAFGGTPPVAERARALGFFERVFDGSEPPEAVLAYLKGQSHVEPTEADFPQAAVERITWKAPFPIIRHHFGLPTVEATRAGIARIAEAQVLFREVMDEGFFDQLTALFTEVMGPIGPVIIDDEVKLLGEAKNAFPRDKAAELVERISLEITDSAKRAQFQKEMVSVLRG